MWLIVRENRCVLCVCMYVCMLVGWDAACLPAAVRLHTVQIDVHFKRPKPMDEMRLADPKIF